MNTPLRVLPVLRAAVAASVLWLCGAAAGEEASQNVEAVAKKVEKGPSGPRRPKVSMT